PRRLPGGSGRTTARRRLELVRARRLAPRGRCWQDWRPGAVGRLEQRQLAQRPVLLLRRKRGAHPGPVSCAPTRRAGRAAIRARKDSPRAASERFIADAVMLPAARAPSL